MAIRGFSFCDRRDECAIDSFHAASASAAFLIVVAAMCARSGTRPVTVKSRALPTVFAVFLMSVESFALVVCASGALSIRWSTTMTEGPFATTVGAAEAVVPMPECAVCIASRDPLKNSTFVLR